MKKLFVIMILVMAAVVVNAQRTPVKVADLQKPIVDNITKDYAGFTIKDATKVVENNATTYEVMVVKGTAHETLCYDKDGKFVKKVVKTEGTTAKPKAAAPAAKPPVKKK
jgi:hypothetical protein